MRVLVTGGAGFIGSNVIKVLIDKGHKVYCLDDFSHANFKNIYKLPCEVITADIRDDNVFKKLPRIDAVIHEAALTDTTIDDDNKMMTVNLGGFKNVLEFCLRKRIILVYASSAGVYGDGPSPMKETQEPRPLNIYSYSKLMCDELAQKYFNKKNISPIVGLRYFNVYGPGEYHKGVSASMVYHLYNQMRDNKNPRVFKFGEQKRDFIYVKDIALATVKALEVRKCTLMNVGTSKARSFNDIISIINKVLGKNLPAEYFDNPYTLAYQNHTEADITNIKNNLGFEPRYSLEEGIEDYIINYLNNSKNLTRG